MNEQHKHSRDPWHLSAAGLLTLSLAALVLLALLPAWKPLVGFINHPITHLQVSGDSRISAQELRQVAAPHIGRGFFSTDVQAVKAAVESQPWVRQASVRRVWPDTLVLQVEEHEPVARWRVAVQTAVQIQEQDSRLLQDDYGMLVNHHAEVFGPVHYAGAARLPLLSAPGQDAFHEVITRYLTLSRIMQDVHLQIAGLHLSHLGSWSLLVEEKTLGIPTIRMQAGRDDVIRRAHRFAELYRSLPSAQAAAITAADLRYTDGIALRGQPGRN